MIKKFWTLESVLQSSLLTLYVTFLVATSLNSFPSEENQHSCKDFSFIQKLLGKQERCAGRWNPVWEPQDDYFNILTPSSLFFINLLLVWNSSYISNAAFKRIRRSRGWKMMRISIEQNLKREQFWKASCFLKSTIFWNGFRSSWRCFRVVTVLSSMFLILTKYKQLRCFWIFRIFSSPGINLFNINLTSNKNLSKGENCWRNLRTIYWRWKARLQIHLLALAFRLHLRLVLHDGHFNKLVRPCRVWAVPYWAYASHLWVNQNTYC